MDTAVDSRSGLTVLEVLVVTAILGILCALLIPAVQQARAAARQTQCSERLRQIGIASHGFLEAHGFFPPSSRGDHYYELLGQMEGPADPSQDVLLDLVHQGPHFSCPSDTLPPFRPHEGAKSVSYAVNNGTHFRFGKDYVNGFEPFIPSHLGRAGRRPQDISDGLSATAAYSERLRVDTSAKSPERAADPLRYTVWLSRTVDLDPGREAEMVNLCLEAIGQQPPSKVWWVEGRHAGYDHHLPPNSMGCYNGTAVLSDYSDGVFPATSYHAGGVNLLLADGHLRFVSQDVNVDAWRAVGTINGSDSIGSF